MGETCSWEVYGVWAAGCPDELGGGVKWRTAQMAEVAFVKLFIVKSLLGVGSLCNLQAV